jgi:hypothetical protein
LRRLQVSGIRLQVSWGYVDARFVRFRKEYSCRITLRRAEVGGGHSMAPRAYLRPVRYAHEHDVRPDVA